MATLQKIQIVNLALRRGGLASSAVLMMPDPQQLTDALEDLEGLMATVIKDGVALPYIFTTNADGVPDGNEDSGLDLWTKEGIALKLAQRILLDMQRDLTPEMNAVLKEQWDIIKIQFYEVPSLKQRNDMPTGQGNNPYFPQDRFYYDGTAK
ncbi:DNA stabilization protein [Phage ST231]|nr:DNA stabilization protein [Phage ST231]